MTQRNPMPGVLPSAKGTVLITAVKFLRGDKERARSLLAPSLHPYLVERVLDSSWYPEADLHGLIRAAAALFPPQEEDPLISIGRAALATLVGDSKYHHLHHATDLESLPRRITALWGTQHNTGEMRLQLLQGGKGSLTLKEFGHPTREMCTLLIGYLDQVLRANGVEQPHAQKRRCVLAGSRFCEWTFEYPAR